MTHFNDSSTIHLFRTGSFSCPSNFFFSRSNSKQSFKSFPNLSYFQFDDSSLWLISMTQFIQSLQKMMNHKSNPVMRILKSLTIFPKSDWLTTSHSTDWFDLKLIPFAKFGESRTFKGVQFARKFRNSGSIFFSEIQTDTSWKHNLSIDLETSLLSWKPTNK